MFVGDHYLERLGVVKYWFPNDIEHQNIKHHESMKCFSLLVTVAEYPLVGGDWFEELA